LFPGGTHLVPSVVQVLRGSGVPHGRQCARGSDRAVPDTVSIMMNRRRFCAVVSMSALGVALSSVTACSGDDASVPATSGDEPGAGALLSGVAIDVHRDPG
jgi:hypothetical protein